MTRAELTGRFLRSRKSCDPFNDRSPSAVLPKYYYSMYTYIKKYKLSLFDRSCLGELTCTLINFWDQSYHQLVGPNSSQGKTLYELTPKDLITPKKFRTENFKVKQIHKSLVLTSGQLHGLKKYKLLSTHTNNTFLTCTLCRSDLIIHIFWHVLSIKQIFILYIKFYSDLKIYELIF